MKVIFVAAAGAAAAVSAFAAQASVISTGTTTSGFVVYQSPGSENAIGGASASAQDNNAGRGDNLIIIDQTGFDNRSGSGTAPPFQSGSSNQTIVNSTLR